MVPQAAAVAAGPAAAAEPVKSAAAPATLASVLAASPAADWQMLDPARTLYMDLPAGRVVIELAPDFAPRTVANVLALVRQHYFDGAAVVRVQDNWVAQWADPAAEDLHPKPGVKPRGLGNAAPRLALETAREDAGLDFRALPDGDVYAPAVGFVSGFPAARDPASHQTWLAHCYGMVGVGRDVAADSGNGAELYAVIGQAPRQLDRNVTLIGRVVWGMQYLASLKRGTGPMGFYTDRRQDVPIARVRLAAALPPGERLKLEILRTDSASFAAVIAQQRARHDPWFVVSPGRIGLCNVPLPVRLAMRLAGSR